MDYYCAVDIFSLTNYALHKVFYSSRQLRSDIEIAQHKKNRNNPDVLRETDSSKVY